VDDDALKLLQENSAFKEFKFSQGWVILKKKLKEMQDVALKEFEEAAPDKLLSAQLNYRAVKDTHEMLFQYVGDTQKYADEFLKSIAQGETDEHTSNNA
jgi:hypothetical protein